MEYNYVFAIAWLIILIYFSITSAILGDKGGIGFALGWTVGVIFWDLIVINKRRIYESKRKIREKQKKCKTCYHKVSINNKSQTCYRCRR